MKKIEYNDNKSVNTRNIVQEAYDNFHEFLRQSSNYFNNGWLIDLDWTVIDYIVNNTIIQCYKECIPFDDDRYQNNYCFERNKSYDKQIADEEIEMITNYVKGIFRKKHYKMGTRAIDMLSYDDKNLQNKIKNKNLNIEKVNNIIDDVKNYLMTRKPMN